MKDSPSAPTGSADPARPTRKPRPHLPGRGFRLSTASQTNDQPLRLATQTVLPSWMAHPRPHTNPNRPANNASPPYPPAEIIEGGAIDSDRPPITVFYVRPQNILVVCDLCSSESVFGLGAGRGVTEFDYLDMVGRRFVCHGHQVRASSKRICSQPEAGSHLSEVREQRNVDLLEPSRVEVPGEVFEVLLLYRLQGWHTHPALFCTPASPAPSATSNFVFHFV